MDATCIGCGCSDHDPCDGGCYWITDVVEGVSVCSSEPCLPHLDRFLAGDLEICPQFRDECPLVLPGDPRFDATLRGVAHR